MILVTGGAGYIGSHFIRQWVRREPSLKLLAVDNLVLGHAEALAFSDNVTLEVADIGDIETMTELMRRYGVKTVVHFAAYAYVGESQIDPEKYFQNNCVKSLNLFAAMQRAGVHEIVFSSTCATYGVPERLPLDESHPQRPINVYGSSKLMIEQALEGYRNAKGWCYVSLRYFNASGADESGEAGESHIPETHLIPLILQAAMGQHPYVEIYGNDYDTPDGTCIRDYIHVSDLADAHLLALAYLQANPGGHVFNLGTSVGTSVKEIIEMCRSVTGKSIEMRIFPRRDGDPVKLVADATRAADVLGWRPRLTLRNIIETAWHWEQSRRY